MWVTSPAGTNNEKKFSCPSAPVDLGIPSAHAKTHVEPLPVFHPSSERPAQIFQDLQTALVNLLLCFPLVADLSVVGFVLGHGISEQVRE